MNERAVSHALRLLIINTELNEDCRSSVVHLAGTLSILRLPPAAYSTRPFSTNYFTWHILEAFIIILIYRVPTSLA